MGMLVLSRMRDESIVIDGGRIVITVAEIRGNKVRLGIKAPEEVQIDRMEVHLAKERERRRAAEDDTEETGDMP